MSVMVALVLFFHVVCQIQILGSFSFLLHWLPPWFFSCVNISIFLSALTCIAGIPLNTYVNPDLSILCLPEPIIFVAYECFHNYIMLKLISGLKKAHQGSALMTLNRMRQITWVMVISDVVALFLFIAFIVLYIFEMNIEILYEMATFVVGFHLLFTILFNREMRRLDIFKSSKKSKETSKEKMVKTFHHSETTRESESASRTAHLVL